MFLFLDDQVETIADSMTLFYITWPISTLTVLCVNRVVLYFYFNGANKSSGFGLSASFNAHNLSVGRARNIWQSGINPRIPHSIWFTATATTATAIFGFCLTGLLFGVIPAC